MAGFGFLTLLLWEIILVAFAALVVIWGRKGMLFCCALLLVGRVATMEGTDTPWVMMGVYLAVLVTGLGIETWVKKKCDIQGLLRLEMGVVGMMLLIALGWAMLPLALVAGAVCGGLILRRFFVPGLSRWLIVLGVERIFFSVIWIVLGI